MERMKPGDLVHHYRRGQVRIVAVSGSHAEVHFGASKWVLPLSELSRQPGSPPRRIEGPRGSKVVDSKLTARLADDAIRGLEHVSLYAWQSEALRAWQNHRYRGVVEAVTGTGKTMVGLAAAGHALADGGRVQVLVPSIELQAQWAVSARKHLPGRLIETLGGGSRPRSASSDVLICVVNSARAYEPGFTPRNSLLVADECHRYGSAANALALSARFERRLGISATYARSDDGNARYLDPYFGETCFRIGYKRAIADGVTARFKVALIPVRFPPADERAYEEFNRQASEARRWLVANDYAPDNPFGEFMKRVSVLSEGEFGLATWKARAFLKNFSEKRRILAETPTKLARLRDLAAATDGADRTILFTQTISAAEEAARTLCARGIISEAIHSQVESERRRTLLKRFGRGELKAIAAPQVLDEGIDVPAADLAVILASSHSRRQMIQRMGRVLRKKSDQRLARFAVFYVWGTSEDPRLGAHETFLEEITSVAEAVRKFDMNARPSEICDFLNDHKGRRTVTAIQDPQGSSAAFVPTPALRTTKLASNGNATMAEQREPIWRDRPFHPSAVRTRRLLSRDAPYALTDPASPQHRSATPGVTANLPHPAQAEARRRPNAPKSTERMSAAQRKRQRDLVEAEREGLTVGQLLARRRAKAESDLELHRIAVSRGMTVKQLRRWMHQDEIRGSNNSQ